MEAREKKRKEMSLYVLRAFIHCTTTIFDMYFRLIIRFLTLLLLIYSVSFMSQQSEFGVKIFACFPGESFFFTEKTTIKQPILMI